MKALLCLLLFSCKTTKQYDFKNIKAATNEDVIKAINNTKIKLRRNDSLYLILFLLFFYPLSITAQTCTLTAQIIVADAEGLLHDADAFLINEGPTTYNVLCPYPKTATLYPNPSTDFFQIKGLDKAYTEGAIFGLDGRFYYNVNVTGEVDVSSLAQGVYVLKIKNSSIFFKFVKQ